MTHLEWAIRHATLFGLTTASDEEMVRGWAEAFERHGYAVAELVEATDYLAAKAPPRFRNEHLGALHERLRQQRAQPAPGGDGTAEAGQWPPCKLCNGCGLASVPSRKALRTYGPPWRGHTEVVYCPCTLGRWMHRSRKGPGCQTLESYEAEVPNWREMVEALAAERQDLAGLGAGASELDRELGRIDFRATARRKQS